MSRKAKTVAAVVAAYEPKPREQAALDSWEERRRGRAPSPRIKIDKQKNGTNSLALDHPDMKTGTLLMLEALGTTSTDFMDGLFMQLASAGSKGPEPSQEGINFMLSVVKGIEPKDEIEAMLAAQMAAVHMASMKFARSLAHVETIPQQDSAERAFNKLTRTFATQMEALKRYRTGGQQRMTVEHVTVHEGGQAIVGNVGHPADYRKNESSIGQAGGGRSESEQSTS